MSSQSSSYPREMSTLDHEANRYSQFRYRQQASASDEFATQNQQPAEFRQQQQQQQAPQVHEALDDDVASEALEGNQELGGGSMSASQSSGQDSYSGQGEPGAGSEDEPTPSTMASDAAAARGERCTAFSCTRGLGRANRTIQAQSRSVP
mgnify:CR=1 FL=1